MKFIVAIDGSQQSQIALEEAVDIAAESDATVVAVHAVDPSVYDEGGTEPVSDIADAGDRLIVESEADAERRGMDLLEDAAEYASRQGVRVETELLYGDPAVAIPEFLASDEADMLFVGHRGLSERLESVLGSVAKALLDSSPVPVTVVK